MNLQNSSATLSVRRAARHGPQPSRELLALALNAAGAVPCTLYSDTFTFASVDDLIEPQTGIAPSQWYREDFWERYLHPDDRAIVSAVRHNARIGWRTVNLSFRIVNDESSMTMFLVGQRSSDRSSARPMFDAYLLRGPNDVGKEPDSDSTILALDQARRDLVRATELAVAGELVGAITHDLRQPLTALLVNLEVASELLRQPTPRIANALAALVDAVDDGHKLRDSVHVLHDLVKHREPIRKKIAINDIVIEVARLVQSEADARQVQLRVLVAQELPVLVGDATMLREALLSVVLDAIENVSLDGAAHVDIETKLLDDSRVELAVIYRRRADSTEDDAWPLRVVRSVAEVHSAAVTIETTSAAELVVRTIWPSAA